MPVEDFVWTLLDPGGQAMASRSCRPQQMEAGLIFILFITVTYHLHHYFSILAGDNGGLSKFCTRVSDVFTVVSLFWLAFEAVLRSLKTGLVQLVCVASL